MYIPPHLPFFASTALFDEDRHRESAAPKPHVTRLLVKYDDETTWLELFDTFINSPEAATTTGLVVGMWDQEGWQVSSEVVVQTLVSAREQLPALRALLIGDIRSDENEISWIIQSDMAPLLLAFPQLEHFGVRGGNQLQLGRIVHANLRTLVVQSGGLDGQIVRDVAGSELPALEHLELWLGTEDYGGTTTIDDVQPLLDGTHFLALRYLGLRNSEIADALAIAVSNAPILERLTVLDLSLGTLGDVGGAALLAMPEHPTLELLDLHHHFLSATLMAQFADVYAGRATQVDLSDQLEAEDDEDESYRYIAVSE